MKFKWMRQEMYETNRTLKYARINIRLIGFSFKVHINLENSLE